MPCLLRRFWPYRFWERPLYVQTPLFVRFIIAPKLSVNVISFLQMATYMKSLARRASLTEGSVKAVKASKAKVASLTSENADLRARVQRLAEDSVKYESDLKHTMTAKAQAEDKEKKA